jgi:hypothetical protein
MDSFPLLQPIEIKQVITKARVKIQSIDLGVSALILVDLMTDDGSVIDNRLMLLAGDDYANWGSDDLYIQNWVQLQLA